MSRLGEFMWDVMPGAVLAGKCLRLASLHTVLLFWGSMAEPLTNVPQGVRQFRLRAFLWAVVLSATTACPPPALPVTASIAFLPGVQNYSSWRGDSFVNALLHSLPCRGWPYRTRLRLESLLAVREKVMASFFFICGEFVYVISSKPGQPMRRRKSSRPCGP